MEQPLLVTRWKALRSSQEVFQEVSEALSLLHPESPYLYCALPYRYLGEAKSHFQSEQLVLGLDNMPPVGEASYLGSAVDQWLDGSEAAFALLGTHDRRTRFGESSACVTAKVRAATENGTTVFVCFGETEHDVAKGTVVESLQAHIQELLVDLPSEELECIQVIYQGAWPHYYGGRELEESLSERLKILRHTLATVLGDEVAAQVSVLLSVPSHVQDMQSLVGATHTFCQGYYYDAATTYPQRALELLKILDDLEAPVSEAPSIEEADEAAEEPATVASAITTDEVDRETTEEAVSLPEEDRVELAVPEAAEDVLEPPAVTEESLSLDEPEVALPQPESEFAELESAFDFEEQSVLEDLTEELTVDDHEPLAADETLFEETVVDDLSELDPGVEPEGVIEDIATDELPEPELLTQETEEIDADTDILGALLGDENSEEDPLKSDELSIAIDDSNILSDAAAGIQEITDVIEGIREDAVQLDDAQADEGSGQSPEDLS